MGLPLIYCPATNRIARTLLVVLLTSVRADLSPAQYTPRDPEATTARPHVGLTFAAVGDAGEPGAVLAGVATSIVHGTMPGQGASISLLLFLGDNFYPTGLNCTMHEQERLIAECLGPFKEAFERLTRDNVHAVPGNHDYYCERLGPIPYGLCIEGNRREARIGEWTYHMIMPARVRRPLSIGSPDSVDFILVDSGLMLGTEPSMWGATLDSLERLLRSSANSPGVQWRILAAHHSPYSVGEHGGWRYWSSRERRVLHVGNCWADGVDPRKYVEEAVSAQDNCTPRYRAYRDSLFGAVSRSGAAVQIMMAGHDHSLQLLDNSATLRAPLPRIFIVSGAAGTRSRVRSPHPPTIWTHSITEEEGLSPGGYVRGTFVGGNLHLQFIDAVSGSPLDMGGRSEFIITPDGVLR